MGEWKMGKRHGRGKCYRNDGSIYEGNWIEDEICGYGRMIWENGDYYVFINSNFRMGDGFKMNHMDKVKKYGITENNILDHG
jgi:hypothetical protein